MNRSSQLFLLRELVRRDFSQRYAGSVFGFAWSIIQPLWQLILFSIVFSQIMRIPLDGEATEKFWIFLFCGLLPWTAMHEGILRCATVIMEHGEMVKKIAFPAEILVAAVVSTALVHQAITLGIFVVALMALGEMNYQTLWLLPIALVFQILLTLGIGYLVAATQVYFRDTVQLLGLVMNAWFYLTPVVYPLLMVENVVGKWALLNPLTVLVTLYRHAFLGGDVERWLVGLVPLSGFTVLFLIVGITVFRHLKPGFSDEI